EWSGMAERDGHPVVKAGTRRVLAVLTGTILVAVIASMTFLGLRGHRSVDLKPPAPRLAATVVSLRLEPCPGTAIDERLVCASGVILAAFAVPTLLDGRPAVAVAALTATAIAAVLIAVVHGVDVRARIAFIGATLGIGVALAAGDLLRTAAHLAGLSDAVPA